MLPLGRETRDAPFMNVDNYGDATHRLGKGACSI
jgi:hypothetical protein